MSRTDFWSGLGFMCLSIFVYILTMDMKKVPLGIGPGDYPRVIAIVLFILGAIQAFQGWRKGSPPIKDLYPPKALVRVLGLFIMTFIYIHLLGSIGFLYLTPFFLIAVMYYFGHRKPLSSITVGIAVTAGIYIVFRIMFHVPLPKFTLF